MNFTRRQCLQPVTRAAAARPSRIIRGVPDPSIRRFDALSLQEAAEASPALANLAAQVRESARHLADVSPVIPPPLRAAVQAGPVDGEGWCLLVKGSAAAAKLRQLVPLMEARLAQAAGRPVRIRLKVASGR